MPDEWFIQRFLEKKNHPYESVTYSFLSGQGESDMVDFELLETYNIYRKMEHGTGSVAFLFCDKC